MTACVRMLLKGSGFNIFRFVLWSLKNIARHLNVALSLIGHHIFDPFNNNAVL